MKIRNYENMQTKRKVEKSENIAADILLQITSQLMATEEMESITQIAQLQIALLSYHWDKLINYELL